MDGWVGGDGEGEGDLAGKYSRKKCCFPVGTFLLLALDSPSEILDPNTTVLFPVIYNLVALARWIVSHAFFNTRKRASNRHFACS